jgi:hypothetical protein
MHYLRTITTAQQEHMTDVAAGAYRRSLARKDAPENAVRCIFKVLRKIALQYYELDDDG